MTCSKKEMHRLLLGLTIATACGLNLAQSHDGCAITLPVQDDKFQPIFLQENGSHSELIIPKNGKIEVPSGDQIRLLCAPSKNHLLQSNRQLTSMSCSNRRHFEISRQQTNANELKCKSVVRGSVVSAGKTCGDNLRGKEFDIGIKVSEKEIIQTIKVCRDESHENTLYTEHIIYGQAISYASNQKHRPSFQTAGVKYTKSAVANSYKQTTQYEALSQLLGSNKLAEKYINSESSLDRGHLSPDADFLYAGLQYSTYFFINVCPQWSAINQGNWLSVEHKVRKVARFYRKPLKILTGTYGTLSLPDINGNPQEIHLISDGERVPVPKFVWKIVMNEETAEGIAIVIVNNPFLETINQEDIICPDICQVHGWSSERWHDVSRGYVYCCDMHTLKRVVHAIPNLHIKRVLSA